MTKRAKRVFLKILLNVWPPYLGPGIRIRSISPDIRVIQVEMKLRFWNQNYVGTQFGGSLYAMADPFFMLILIENLGKGYTVWDKAATIRFKRPGRGRVTARFELTEAQIQDVRDTVERDGKAEPSYSVQVLADDGTVVAEIDKLLSIRRSGTQAGAKP